jgi:ABC-type proline/glycine betaine transport system substrate-binding protein
MLKTILRGTALAGIFALAATAAHADAVKESCKTVRFSDVGWTDITAPA